MARRKLFGPRSFARAIFLLALLLGGGGLSQCQALGGGSPAARVAQNAEATSAATLSQVPAYGRDPYVYISASAAFPRGEAHFTESELARAKEGPFETYSPLDALGRCGTALACAGRDTMPTAKRGDIRKIKPTGWRQEFYSFVDQEALYNRCHLIAHSLTGEDANAQNLITGTRYMNVQGMLPFEEEAVAYIKRTGNHVLYRATPIFGGDNLLASGVQLEAQSVEDDGEGIEFNVYCYNVEPGVAIDYSTGDSHAE